MLDKQISTLTTILSNEEIQSYADEGFWSLIQAVVTSDPFAGLSGVRNIKDIIFHMPTLLFWNKMKRFLLGTFYTLEDQVKMAAKFDHDNQKYSEFVKRQIYLINELDDEQKVDYYANLTRCFLLTELTQELYFKLAKHISMCTPFELDYLASIPKDYQNENSSAMISSLYQYGLFSQQETATGSFIYVLSDFGKALKDNSLNFNEGHHSARRLSSYDDITPSDPEPISVGVINALLGEGVPTVYK